MATTPRRDQDAVGEANLDGSSRHIIVTGQDVPQMMAVTPRCQIRYTASITRRRADLA